MSTEFDCAECGIHVVDIIGNTTSQMLCLVCTYLPERHGPSKTLRPRTDAQLIEEVCRRIQKQESGLCTYCDRKCTDAPCAFQERHIDVRAHPELHMFGALFEEVRARFSVPHTLPPTDAFTDSDMLEEELNRLYGKFTPPE